MNAHANPDITVVDVASPEKAAASIITYLAATKPGKTRICVIPGSNPLPQIGIVIAMLIETWSALYKTPLSFLAANGGDIAVSQTPLPKKGGVN